MTYTAIIFFLKKIWIFIKQYWKYFFVASTFILAYILIRKPNIEDISKQLEDIKKSHENELKELDIIRNIERKAYQENERRMTEQLLLIQKQYEDAKKELDNTKKEQIKNLVQQYSDQPSVLAEKLSQLTGFKVILPEEE